MELFTLLMLFVICTCLIYGYANMKKPAGQIISSLESDLAEIENLLKVQESNNDPKENKNMLSVLNEKVENSRKNLRKSKQVVINLEEKLENVECEITRKILMHKIKEELA